MKLKKVRIAKGYQAKQVAAFLKRSVDNRLDSSLYSKMENGVCLPTPKQFRKICFFFGVEPTDIYTKEDVDFGLDRKRVKRDQADRDVDIYKLTVRLPIALATGLQAKVRRNGFPSITAYICECIKKLS